MFVRIHQDIAVVRKEERYWKIELGCGHELMEHSAEKLADVVKQESCICPKCEDRIENLLRTGAKAQPPQMPEWMLKQAEEVIKDEATVSGVSAVIVAHPSRLDCPKCGQKGMVFSVEKEAGERPQGYYCGMCEYKSNTKETPILAGGERRLADLEFHTSRLEHPFALAAIEAKIREAKLKGYLGDACPSCKSFTLLRTQTLPHLPGAIPDWAAFCDTCKWPDNKEESSAGVPKTPKTPKHTGGKK